ncbi:hypothetical protein [Sulfuracidifex metallicus]|uniref:NAD(P)/FAD-dependent oxidoreductase n=1 Tax=Sulfuracidifex metallicus DSM 6482 = JCM 9184 TaxID=523847 RepID=A0A6A9QNG4_SULME|nr:hypothetical protein [Sulfuracidifex metallicus]MUN28721.1 hypothetical protein [Sulfuracidifex metallicus DSM 6482 = JCM 9184]WOE50758.1 hypothetical protein RQ359_002327 [Sulfuracidifex metallicus DSM 6482 = JCM 9184]
MKLENIVIGGGLSGLLISALTNSPIIEEQPSIGGILSFSQLDGMKIPFILPLVKSQEVLSGYGAKIEKISFDLDIIKERYLLKKVCPLCEDLPIWLNFQGDLYLIKNINDIISNLGKNVQVIKDHAEVVDPYTIKSRRHGMIKIENKIFYTAPATCYSNVINRDELKFRSSIISVFVVRKIQENNRIIIDGGSSTSFSHVIYLNDFPERGISSMFVYAFFDMSSKQIELRNIISDLKRQKILNPDQVLSIRSKVIKEAILIGEPLVKLADVTMEGRLGRWKNFSIEDIARLYSPY